MSIGSDAVYAAEEYYASGCHKTGQTAIEQISEVYGKQAVVVSRCGRLKSWYSTVQALLTWIACSSSR